MYEQPVDWQGVLVPAFLSDELVAHGHRVADAAKAGDWDTLLRLLRSGDEQLWIKDRAGGAAQWRPGSPKWFTPLHHAAWHGAPREVIASLLELGALRSLVDAKGRTAKDVAVERHGAAPLVELLEPPESPLSRERIHLLDRHLKGVIDRRVQRMRLFEKYTDSSSVLRYPPVGVLHEVRDSTVWFPIPGMYGGFLISLRQGYLETTSWCRVAGGSGQLHVITHEGPVLVDEGFV